MNNSINNNLSNGTRMVNGRNGVAAGANATGQDVTDNVSVNAAAAMFNGNGFGGGLRTKVISSQSQISSVRESERVVKKSFIQQRVEKLYGNAEGVVINKQIYSHSNNSGSTNERKYLNNIANENITTNKNCYTTPASAVHLNGNANGTTNGTGATNNGGGVGGGVVTKENLDVNGAKEFGEDPDMEALPVMRHLRPEFRAQLQLYSPKKVPKTSPGRFSNGSNASSNGVVSSAGSLNGGGSSSNNNNNHIASNGDLSHHHHSHLSQHLTNGKLTTNGTSSSNTTSSLLSSSIFSSSTSVATVVESKTTTKSSSSSYHQTTTEEASSALSATTKSVTTNAANAACDATGPTIAANQHNSESESPSTIVATEAAEPAVVVAVTAQASVEKEAATIGVEPSIPVQQQKQEVSSSKMKLSEPCVNGGDGVDNVAIIRNGTSIKNGHHCHDDHEDKENINGGAAVPELAPSAKVPAATPVKDGNHFLQVMKNEQNRLLTMAADIEREAEQCKTDGVEISEEVAGYVLVAAGKARLLCSQKMKQFEGLCHNNLNQIPGEKFQTTNEDLQGFWDMVMLQVNDVDASFVEIDSFRRNGWKKPAPVSPVPQARSTARSTKLTKRPFKAPAPAANGSATDAEAKKAAAAKREAQRKQLMELKRKQKLASAQQNVEIFVPGSSGSAEVSNGVATS